LLAEINFYLFCSL